MRSHSLAALALLALTSEAVADEFDVEFALGYEASRQKVTTRLGSGPVPPLGPITQVAESDIDDVLVSGSWYFGGGVSIDEGPRSRAAFLARASSVGFSYRNTSGDVSARLISGDPAIPSEEFGGDLSGNAFSVDLRWVWDSAWFGLASLVTGDLDLEGTSGNLNIDGYALGIGRYLGSGTSLELAYLRQDAEAEGLSSSTDDALLSFTHIGNIGTSWQYGADVGLSTEGVGGADGSYDIRFTLYPSRDLALGVGVDGQLGSAFVDRTGWKLFGSWFPNESFGIEASYGSTIVDDPPPTDTDEDVFGVRGVLRF